jgi:hypothetical protein
MLNKISKYNNHWIQQFDRTQRKDLEISKPFKPSDFHMHHLLQHTKTLYSSRRMYFFFFFMIHTVNSYFIPKRH